MPLFDLGLGGVGDHVAWLTDPAGRLYWGFLFSSLALALLWLVRRKRGVGEALRGAYDILRHPSSLADLRIALGNGLLKTLVWGPLLWGTLRLSVAILGVLDDTFGSHDGVRISPELSVLFYTLVLFLAWDFSRYLLHRWMHSTWLWRFHQVHHSAEVMTPLTLHRVHPVEQVLYALRGLLVSASVSALWFYVFRSTSMEWQILGVNGLGFVFNFAGGNLRHSHVPLSYGPVLERIFISPAQHQLHHSRKFSEQTSNYGTWLAVWDRVAGSWRPARPESDAEIEFGVAHEDLNHRPRQVLSMWLAPVGLWRDKEEQ